MADQPHPQRQRLDATGSREVVYCHQCQNEWYRDEHGLVCSRCNGDITEIISADNDPRPPEIPAPPSMDELRGLRDHNPWPDNDSDPEEGDIRELFGHLPQGRTIITSRTFGGPRQVFEAGSSRQPPNQDDAAQTFQDFQGILSGLLGQNIQQGQPGGPGPEGQPSGSGAEGQPGGPGREGQHPDHPPPPFAFRPGPSGEGNPPVADGSNMGGTPTQPRPFGGRITFQFGRSPPRTIYRGEEQGPQDLTTILRDLMLVMQPNAPDDGANGGANAPIPLGGLQGLFAGLLNPAMAVSGDAVYTQEALDRIITTLMEQHPTSNAPGPASEEVIAALPKKKIDEKMLGPEGKAECSVCMDSVVLDDEVLIMPCSHWFHEVCVKAWLKEHNTCPICRTGVGNDGSAVPAGPNAPPDSENQAPGNQASGNQAAPVHRTPFEMPDERAPDYRRRATFLRRRPSDNEARLASIRDTANPNRDQEGTGAEDRGREMNPGSRRERSLTPAPNMPGGFSNSSYRNSIFRRQESDTDAGSTGRRDQERERERERDSRNSDHVSRNSDNSNSSGGGTVGGVLGNLFRRFSGGGGSGQRNN